MDNLKQVLEDAVSSGRTKEVKEILRMEPEFLFEFFTIPEMYIHIAENGTREHLEWFDEVLIRYSSSVENIIRKELENVDSLKIVYPHLATVYDSIQRDNADERKLRIETMVYERIYIYEQFGFGLNEEELGDLEDLENGYIEDEDFYNDLVYDHLHYIARRHAVKNKRSDVMEYLVRKVKEAIVWFYKFKNKDAWYLELISYEELEQALKHGGYNVAQILIDSYGCFRKANYKKSIRGIIVQAIKSNNYDVLTFLYKNNFNIHYTVVNGEPPLMYCTKICKTGMIKFYLSNGADAIFRNNDNQNALIIAHKLLKEEVEDALNMSFNDVKETDVKKFIKNNPESSRHMQKLIDVVEILEDATPLQHWF